MRVVEIEATNRCNTRCLHCPHETISRPKGTMTWDTFQVVADKVLAYGKTAFVDFAGMGEPTLNPDLYRFIAYLSGKLNTYITTNASALTPRNIERLIEAGLTTVIVSFNGVGAELYETMMGGLSFQRAESHLTDLVRRADGRIDVMANVSVTRQTERHLVNIREYLNNVGVQNVVFSKCHSRGGHLRESQICNTPMPPLDSSRCDIYARTLFVAWTGDVLACCHDLDGVAPVGSLLTGSMQEIVTRKQAVLQQGVRYEICGDCNDLYRFSQGRLPDDGTISDWVYNLYLGPQERWEFLNRVAQHQDNRIKKFSSLLSLEHTFQLGSLRGSSSKKHSHQANAEGRLSGSPKSDSHSFKNKEVTLVSWMSQLYQQVDESTAELLPSIERNERLLKDLICRSKVARITVAAYQRVTDWIDWMRCRITPRLRRFIR